MNYTQYMQHHLFFSWFLIDSTCHHVPTWKEELVSVCVNANSVDHELVCLEKSTAIFFPPLAYHDTGSTSIMPLLLWV
jgi:hypothetical protein